MARDPSIGRLGVDRGEGSLVGNLQNKDYVEDMVDIVFHFFF